MTRHAGWIAGLAAWLGCMLALPAIANPVDASTANFQPYTARYQVSYRGLSGGEIEVSFRRAKEPNQWQ